MLHRLATSLLNGAIASRLQPDLIESLGRRSSRFAISRGQMEFIALRARATGEASQDDSLADRVWSRADGPKESRYELGAGRDVLQAHRTERCGSWVQLRPSRTFPYDYAALEPHYSGEIVELHHGQASRRLRRRGGNSDTREARRVPRERSDFGAIQSASRRPLPSTYSGHVLHSIFWKNLSP